MSVAFAQLPGALPISTSPLYQKNPIICVKLEGRAIVLDVSVVCLSLLHRSVQQRIDLMVRSTLLYFLNYN